MSGKGILAIWNDCAKGEETNYENWYQNEHLPERLGVPGFIRGRRYENLVDSPKFFHHLLCLGFKILRNWSPKIFIDATVASNIRPGKKVIQ